MQYFYSNGITPEKSRSITVNKQEFRYVISTGKYNENWEFDLELVDTKKSCEVYNYIKRDIKVFNGESVEYIHLHFELDILFKIKIKTQHNTFTLL